MLVQIPGTNFVRDTESMVLINKDRNGLVEYQMKRNMMANQNQELNNVKQEINNVKQDMQEIKNLLLQLMEKNSNG